MEDIDFSPEFCRFIQTTIPAVDAAELLLVFHARPGELLHADEAVRLLETRVSSTQAATYLETFESRGVLEAVGGAWRYRPEGPMAAFADRLAQAYAQRPVTLVRIIYALRDSKIQSFADAFKLRRS